MSTHRRHLRLALLSLRRTVKLTAAIQRVVNDVTGLMMEGRVKQVGLMKSITSPALLLRLGTGKLWIGIGLSVEYHQLGTTGGRPARSANAEALSPAALPLRLHVLSKVHRHVP